MPEGAVVVYSVRGLWRWLDMWNDDEQIQLAPFRRPTLQEALKGFSELGQDGIAPTLDVPYLDLTAIALAAVGLPPDSPGPPHFDGVDDGGWLPEPPPPNVRRIVRMRAGGFVPRALTALAASDARGLRTLNPVAHTGRLPPGIPVPPGMVPMPLVVSRPADATAAGQGRFEDRDAPADAVLYRLAQSDWFGRWD
jgi:hypothetical protein